MQLVEAGDGVGGTWYWNRYPGAASTPRATPTATCSPGSCSTSGSGTEHFAAQPETERYLNHVVDRFDLRRHMRFGAGVTSAVFDEPSGTWTVTLGDGTDDPRRGS